MRVHARRQVESVGDGVAEAGDTEHADPVGVGGEEADEPRLHGAAGVLDGDDGLAVVAEDGGAVVGAGDRHRSPGRHRRRLANPAILAGEAEHAVVAERERVVGVDVVVGGAEEHELAVGEPGQDRVDGGERVHPAAHRVEVLDGELDVVDGPPDVGLDLGGLGGAVDLDLGPRFQHALALGGVRGDVDQPVVLVSDRSQHRVHEEVDAQAAALEDHPQRVDEERHVVGDDEQHRVLGVPAVALAVGGHHTGDTGAAGAHTTQGEVGHGDGVDVVELAVVDVVGGQLRVVQRQEAHEQRVVGLAQGGDVAQPAERLGDGVALVRCGRRPGAQVRVHVHASSRPTSSSSLPPDRA